MNYVKIAGLFVVAFLLNRAAPAILESLTLLGGTETAIANSLWCLGLFLVFGWACSKLSEGTVFPNFTLQLLVGIVLHDALAPIGAAVIQTGRQRLYRKQGTRACIRANATMQA